MKHGTSLRSCVRHPLSTRNWESFTASLLAISARSHSLFPTILACSSLPRRLPMPALHGVLTLKSSSLRVGVIGVSALWITFFFILLLFSSIILSPKTFAIVERYQHRCSRLHRNVPAPSFFMRSELIRMLISCRMIS